MDYVGILEAVYGRLDELGVAGRADAGEPPTEEALAAAETEMGFRIPAELREFYRTVGDGFSLYWETDHGDAEKLWGGFHVPELAELVGMYAGWRELVLYTPERAEEYGFPHTTDPARAKQTAARMWHWLPVIREANGDAICLDLGAPGCPAVFDRHDWVDGGTGDNGHVLAPDWRAFLAGWGSVCFQPPRRLYWPLCFWPGGVTWDGDEFHTAFRVPGLAVASASGDHGGGS